MSFQDSIEILLDDEGGYVNDPVDPGGETKYGISKRSYPALDIEKLTRQEAIDIYYQDYWIRNGYGDVIHSAIADKLFNLSVLMGAKAANKLAQQALMACSEKLKIDGVLGSKTIDAINNKTTSHRLIAALRSEAAGYFRALIARKPELKKYKNGWLTRAYS